MSLQPGTHLGPYEILAPLGAGGMGEVYRACDTRLDRIVAIKVLSAHLSDDPALRDRFDREARAISSLDHPHICSLYDIGHERGIDFLVMQYLEGESLAARLAMGVPPPSAALQWGVEIADALDAAHRRGIVHRDLKPGNVMITKGGAKLLDFGLAKSVPTVVVGMPSALTAIATTPQPLTAKGTIVGTIQYMAPEQLEGQEADARSDIFSFGAVLYELLTGKKAFEGKSQASLIAAILEHDPQPMTSIRPLTPPALDRVVRKCLAKDPDDRWQGARDLRDELRWISEAASQPGAAAPGGSAWAVTAKSGRLAWATAAICVLTTLTVLAWTTLRYATPELPLLRLDLVTPETSDPVSIALSPDGRQLVFPAATDGAPQLWLRSLDQPAARALAGTEGASYPFWSPDSRSIGFFADSKLFRLDVAGGRPELVADAPVGRGGTWSRDDIIVFSTASVAGGELTSVPARGGRTSLVIRRAAGEGSHRWPSFLPDGRQFLFYVSFSRPEVQGVYVGSLDSPNTRRLLAADTAAVYAPPGYLLTIRQGVLVAAPFNAARGALSGEPFPVAPTIASDANLYRGAFSVSAVGMLAYRIGGLARRELAWMDRSGARRGTLGPPDPDNLIFAALALDGQRAAATRTVQGNSDVWLIDAARGAPIRLTSDPSLDDFPVWAPDGGRVAFRSNRNGVNQIFERPTGGAAGADRLLASSQSLTPSDWSSDGRLLLCVRADLPTKTGNDLWALPLDGTAPFAVLETPFDEDEGQFSPDGRWIAYRSNESGRAEIYVQPFPGPGQKRLVSTAGGAQPRWRRDGKELFYLAADSKLMAVPVTLPQHGGVLDVGKPVALFPTRLTNPSFPSHQYAVAADGQRFLMNVGADERVSPITVVQNWTAALPK